MSESSKGYGWFRRKPVCEKHCWHERPPDGYDQFPDVCCQCGRKRQNVPQPLGGHGEHAPRTYVPEP